MKDLRDLKDFVKSLGWILTSEQGPNAFRWGHGEVHGRVVGRSESVDVPVFEIHSFGILMVCFPFAGDVFLGTEHPGSRSVRSWCAAQWSRASPPPPSARASTLPRPSPPSLALPFTPALPSRGASAKPRTLSTPGVRGVEGGVRCSFALQGARRPHPPQAPRP